MRIVIPLLLALEGVPPGRFFVFNLAGALVWAVFTSLAGYGLGNAVDRLADDVGVHPVPAALAVALAVGLAVLFLRRRRLAVTADADSSVE